MRRGTTSRVMAADRPYGEFYDFYSVSAEYFGYTLVYFYKIIAHYLLIIRNKKHKQTIKVQEYNFTA
jgi:hypothetical protein